MPDMTLEQLTQHIKATTDPIIKEISSTVSDVVKEAVAKAMAPSDDPAKGTKQAAIEATIKAAQEAGDPKQPSLAFSMKRTRQKGEAFGAVVRALKRGKNDLDAACYYLKKHDTNNQDLVDILREHAKFLSPDELGLKAMTAGDPETGGILIPQPVSAEVIDILRARVVVRRFNPVTLPMPNGNYRFPRKTQGTQGYYVGESESPTTSKVKTGSLLSTYKKLVTVVPASNDLFRFSSPGADQIIRNDIVDGNAVTEDQAFLRGNPADPNTSPRGLRYWAKDDNIINATGSTGGDSNLAAVTATLANLILKLISANVPMSNPGWIFSPRTYMALITIRTTNGPFAFRDEMSRGTFWGWPFAYTTSIPETLTDGGNTDESEIMLTDFADVVIGDSERLIIDASDVAAYEESGSVKAAFTRDETVIRSITEHDLIVRRAESVAVAKQVRWRVGG